MGINFLRIAYFDCFSGASGDMIVGALLDCGVSIDGLKRQLGTLGVSGYEISCSRAVKKGISCTRFLVSVPVAESHPHRHLKDIKALIDASGLEEEVKSKSSLIFERLAAAEAKVHGTSREEVHFHEVGAIDSIIDVVGSVIALKMLGIEKIYSSRVNCGSGFSTSSHGTMPVPSPAAMELLSGAEIYSSGVEKEILTPTGAAILSTLASSFGPMPALILERVGYGGGAMELGIPNVLRVLVGQAVPNQSEQALEAVSLVEANIDDMNPQLFEYVMERLFESGALDVYLTPVQMKKGRPATLLTAVCPVNKCHEISKVILKETTTIGVRFKNELRHKAARIHAEVATKYGMIRIKLASFDGELINLQPEYDDCKKAALAAGVPLKEVIDEAKAIAMKKDFGWHFGPKK